MLRYYENLGLIQPHRASNNYRSYTQKDIRPLAKVVIASSSDLPVQRLS
ncbi:MerR family transcriptional regulator [Acinetobacter baumannii]